MGRPAPDARTWRKISDYLGHLETAEDTPSLLGRIAQGLEDVVPFDIGGGLVSDTLEIICGLAPVDLVRVYMERYRMINPTTVIDRNGSPRSLTDRVRWADYPDTEFYVDFARPHGLGYGVSAIRPGRRYTVCLHRSRCGKGFTERDVAVVEILNTHVNNLLAARAKLAGPPILPGSRADEIRFRFPRLSRRECQVLSHLSHGLTAREIACTLHMGIRTAESHVAHIYHKLGVQRRLEAIRLVRGEEEDEPSCLGETREIDYGSGRAIRA